ncbi:MAG: A/G-specific adenine glycosylase [Pseudomonadota bacterium]
MVVDSEAQFAHRILRWFDTNARDLPWRLPPGTPLPVNDPAWPYRVWLSEIMLQQTTVAAVKPYFGRFTARWPTVEALAGADDGDVMAAWAGLGYYARARNLLACARAVKGAFPDTEAALQDLPGIGTYTAAAIAAIAFGKRAVVVDGNVERVIARWFAVDTPMPGAKPRLRDLTERLTPDDRAGDFAQAMMDVGATICTPRSPACLVCPIAQGCAGKRVPELYPVKLAKGKTPERTGTAWWIENDGRVWLVRRPDKGMLGGMRGLPSDDWDRRGWKPGVATREEGKAVRHVFTHFALTLTICKISPETGCDIAPDGEWWPIDRLAEAGLPSLFAKAAQSVLEETSI